MLDVFILVRVHTLWFSIKCFLGILPPQEASGVLCAWTHSWVGKNAKYSHLSSYSSAGLVGPAGIPSVGAAGAA